MTKAGLRQRQEPGPQSRSVTGVARTLLHEPLWLSPAACPSRRLERDARDGCATRILLCEVFLSLAFDQPDICANIFLVFPFDSFSLTLPSHPHIVFFVGFPLGLYERMLQFLVLEGCVDDVSDP